MAWNYGFFNSVNGDRVYNADNLNDIFEGLVSNGVYESVGNKLAVQPNSGMTIHINTGRGWFNKHWVNNDNLYVMTLENANQVLNRYCAVCIRVDDSDSVRTAVPFLKYSDFATEPLKPSMEHSEHINEYCLAYIYIPAKATSISASDIEDTRQDRELCGWVTGLIEQITPDTLYDQFTDQFTDWFSHLIDIIDENVETTLVNALPKAVTIELLADSWVADSQVVSLVGMNSTKSVIVTPNEETKAYCAEAGIKCSGQNFNNLEFTCENQPTENIKVDILYMGV